MTKQSRGRPATSTHVASQSTAAPPAASKSKSSRSRHKQQQQLSAPRSLVPPLLPDAIVLLVALAGVTLELTTAAHFTQSKELMSVLKKCFIAFVCLTSRVQLATVFAPPNKPKTLKNAVSGHCKALLVAILANSAGTTVIRPLFGAAPQYEETVQLVVPIYFAVEAAIALLRVPPAVLNFAITLGVSWLKAVTIAKMVAQWQSRGLDAHPAGFVLVSTANLYASGLVLRFVKHYSATQRLVALSAGVVWSLARIVLLSAAIGLVAHGATHLMTQRERQVEATALNVLVAWFALDKYWKAPLASALAYGAEAVERRAKRKRA